MRRFRACCLGVGLTALVLASIPAGAAPVTLQPYEDPEKLFSISYPQGWQVKRLTGTTYFFLDDPDEGTSFTLTPAGALQGEMNAAQALKVFVTTIRKKYPDFKVVGQKQRSMQATRDGTIVDVSATWTNLKKVPMKGWGNLGVITQVGKGKTIFSYLGYQAPAKGFNEMEPVFDRMIRSLKFAKAK